MLVVFLCACGLSFAQEAAPAPSSVDADITVTGRDDSVIPVPPPWRQAAITLPEIVPEEVPPLRLPPVPPPPVDWSAGLPAALPQDETRPART
ncbi:MAG TPA: hypothetical protein VHE79_09470 [Spirochaetia bacterium]